MSIEDAWPTLVTQAPGIAGILLIVKMALAYGWQRDADHRAEREELISRLAKREAAHGDERAELKAQLVQMIEQRDTYIERLMSTLTHTGALAERLAQVMNEWEPGNGPSKRDSP